MRIFIIILLILTSCGKEHTEISQSDITIYDSLSIDGSPCKQCIQISHLNTDDKRIFITDEVSRVFCSRELSFKINDRFLIDDENIKKIIIISGQICDNMDNYFYLSYENSILKLEIDGFDVIIERRL